MPISKVGTYGFAYSGSSVTSLAQTYSTINLGDICIVTSATTSATVYVNALSGGGCTSWTPVTFITGGTPSQATGIALWFGVVTTVGSVTLTASLSAANTGPVMSTMQFTNGTGASTVWTADVTSPAARVASNATMTFPSMSALTTGTLWYGYTVPTNVGSVGSTANFTYQREGSAATPDFWSNIIAYRVLTATGAVTAPTAPQNTAGVYSRLGAIFKAAVPAGPTTRGQHFAVLGHHEQERSGELWTPPRQLLVPRPARPRHRRILDLAPALAAA